MEIEFDPVKRQQTLEQRGLDMADAGGIFEDTHMTYRDIRKDYGEDRYLTFGYLNQRMVFVAWTRRGHAMRIISMRKANAREEREFASLFGR